MWTFLKCLAKLQTVISRYGKLLLGCTLLLLFPPLLYTASYLYNDTPLPVYILDALHIRHHFLPNLSCPGCNNFTYPWLITNPTACAGTSDVFLLVAIASYHVNLNARRAIRQSWGSIKSHNGRRIVTLFFLAKHEDQNMNKLVQSELTDYQDIVQSDFKEDYRMLSHKSVTILRWMQTFCPSAQFLLKTDDDAFNIPQRFIDYLSALDGYVSPFIGGYCFTVYPDRRLSSKFYVQPSIYPTVFYPTYCSGPGYVLSRAAARSLLRVSTEALFIPMEDVFITGVCRVVAGLDYTRIPGCVISRDDINTCSAATWAKNSHNVVPEMHLTMWNEQVLKASLWYGCIVPKLRAVIISIVILVIVGRCMLCVFRRMRYKVHLATG